jgi:hypothetical protein
LRRRHDDTGIVDDAVDSAEGLDRCVEQADDIGFFRDVAPDDNRLAAGGLDRGSRLARFSLPA